MLVCQRVIQTLDALDVVQPIRACKPPLSQQRDSCTSVRWMLSTGVHSTPRTTAWYITALHVVHWLLLTSLQASPFPHAWDPVLRVQADVRAGPRQKQIGRVCCPLAAPKLRLSGQPNKLCVPRRPVCWGRAPLAWWSGQWTPSRGRTARWRWPSSCCRAASC